MLFRSGHIERACKNEKPNPNKTTVNRNSQFRKPKKKQVNQVEHMSDKQSGESDEEYLHVMSLSSNTEGYWVTPLLEGNPVQMQVDTGAAVSLISEMVNKEQLKHLKLKPAKLTLKTYTGETVPVKGVLDVMVELNKQQITLPLSVVEGQYPALLGRTLLEQIKLIWPEVHMIANDGATLTTILQKHANVFTNELSNM